MLLPKYLCQHKQLWYLSHVRAARDQTSLRSLANHSPHFTHTQSMDVEDFLIQTIDVWPRWKRQYLRIEGAFVHICDK